MTKASDKHPHKDGEILTYIRDEEMLHRDTAGNEARLDKTHCIMNAGHMLGDGLVKALQIFLRPNASSLEPMVQFHEFPEETTSIAGELSPVRELPRCK